MSEFSDDIEIPEIPEIEDMVLEEDEKKEVSDKPKKLKEMKPIQKEIEVLYAQFERMKTETKKYQDLAKELKEELVNLMVDNGYDDIIVNGLDNIVQLTITYPEHEVLNKKALAERLGVKIKELSKPEIIIALTKEGKITEEMIQEFTILEERMLFSASEYKPD